LRNKSRSDGFVIPQATASLDERRQAFDEALKADILERQKRRIAPRRCRVDRRHPLGAEARQIVRPAAFGPVPDGPSPPKGCEPTMRADHDR
jgi:hypothetical protein